MSLQRSAMFIALVVLGFCAPAERHVHISLLWSEKDYGARAINILLLRSKDAVQTLLNAKLLFMLMCG